MEDTKEDENALVLICSMQKMKLIVIMVEL